LTFAEDSTGASELKELLGQQLGNASALSDAITPAMAGPPVIFATVTWLSVSVFTVMLVAVLRRRRAAANGKLLR